MAVIRVRVQPRASRSEIVGREGDVWRVRLTAPPAEGRANAALVALLAETLDVRRSDVAILRGQTSRDKLVEIAGLGEDQVASRLADEASR